MGELREYLQEALPNFGDPVIFISTDFIPGCPKCNSSATVYYITLMERKEIPEDQNVEKAENHKFPIDIFINYPYIKGKPKQIVIGTKRASGKLQMILRRVVD